MLVFRQEGFKAAMSIALMQARLLEGLSTPQHQSHQRLRLHPIGIPLQLRLRPIGIPLRPIGIPLRPLGIPLGVKRLLVLLTASLRVQLVAMHMAGGRILLTGKLPLSPKIMPSNPHSAGILHQPSQPSRRTAHTSR